ncbi:MAG: hypothetical protein M1840_006731 [Geoglossum simile]|nr:MAG: hypothetical protein M1840_006731 [Geoglossum simile]
MLSFRPPATLAEKPSRPVLGYGVNGNVGISDIDPRLLALGNNTDASEAIDPRLIAFVDSADANETTDPGLLEFGDNTITNIGICTTTVGLNIGSDGGGIPPYETNFEEQRGRKVTKAVVCSSGRCMKFTPGDDELIMKMKKDKMTDKKISEMFQKAGKNRSGRSIAGRRFRIDQSQNIPRRKTIPFTTQEVALLGDLRKKKTPWKEIAEEFPKRSIAALMDKFNRTFPRGNIQKAKLVI